MEKHDKLVAALRTCSSELNCGDCPLLYRDSCSSDELMSDAADAIEGLVESVHIRDKHLDELNRYIWELEDKQPHWVSVEERKPPEYTDVWCAVYVTDFIYVEDGETPEEAIQNRQREAARNPRVTLGSYSEDEGWTDGYFGMPMVCQPDYWLEMTIPEPPKEDA